MTTMGRSLSATATVFDLMVNDIRSWIALSATGIEALAVAIICAVVLVGTIKEK